ncbi:hypothetical protein LINPERHAP1_LOCUS17777 [Linum perenne]
MSMQFATKIFSSHIAWLGGKVRPTIAECYGMHFHCWGGLEYQKVRHLCFNSVLMPIFVLVVVVGI